MMLALRMGRTLAELGATMSAQEFALWQALYLENHWGELYADQRAGIIASTIANYAGMQRAKGAAPARPSDFMPYKPKGYDDDVEVEADPLEYFTSVAAGMDKR